MFALANGTFYGTVIGPLNSLGLAPAGGAAVRRVALGNLGLALQEVRRFDKAITAHQDAAAIYRQTGDRHSEGIALGNLEAARAAQA